MFQTHQKRIPLSRQRGFPAPQQVFQRSQLYLPGSVIGPIDEAEESEPLPWDVIGVGTVDELALIEGIKAQFDEVSSALTS